MCDRRALLYIVYLLCEFENKLTAMMCLIIARVIAMLKCLSL